MMFLAKTPKKPTQKPGLLSGLTRRWRLDLDLLPAVPSSAAAAAICWRLLAPLHLALVREQKLDVLLLERVGGAARRAHVEVGGQLAPLLVLVDLRVGRAGHRYDRLCSYNQAHSSTYLASQ